MALEKPPLAEASPGAPITAQAWNDIVTGLGDLYDAVLAFGSATVRVDPQLAGVTVPGARVIAEAASIEANPVAALPPIGPRTEYLLAGIAPGEWRIRVEAPGLQSAITSVIELPTSEPVVVEMEAAGPVVPDVFGMTVLEARAKLNDAGVITDRLRLIDTAGLELSAHDVPTDHTNSEVLVQTPGPQAVLVSAETPVRLVIAAPLVQTETVTMPSLIGLTINEATSALQALGLTIADTQVRS
ncbi:MAG: hypothetical protein AAGA37_09285 [Actinomycetota bacterium]